MTIETVLLQLQFDSAIKDAVSKKITKDKSLIREIADTAYSGDSFEFPLCRRMPLTRLAVIVHLLTEKFTDYKNIGASDDIIWNTFRDVSLRANLYFKKTGKVGLTKEDVIWFRHIMNVCIFKIGVLQYQKFEMIYLDEETIGEPYMVFTKEQKEELSPGTPVINCHIQKGANIGDALVEKSLVQAEAFFRECYPLVEYKAFLCYSWLLYPPMLQALSDKSNIKQFAKHFSIISSCNDPEQANENLFDDSKDGISHKLTSLQKIAREHNDLLGFGCGIIML